MDIIGYGSGDDGRDYLPICPYCGMEMVEDDFYKPRFYCVNPECETYKPNESEEGND